MVDSIALPGFWLQRNPSSCSALGCALGSTPLGFLPPEAPLSQFPLLAIKKRVWKAISITIQIKSLLMVIEYLLHPVQKLSWFISLTVISSSATSCTLASKSIYEETGFPWQHLVRLKGSDTSHVQVPWRFSRQACWHEDKCMGH